MNRWNVSAAIDTYNKALKVQEDALADARARLEAVRAVCRTPKRNGGGADAERGAHGDTRETEKNKLIAALMRDTACLPSVVSALSYQRLCCVSFSGHFPPHQCPSRPFARPCSSFGAIIIHATRGADAYTH
jgi:hypothetical protein